MEMTAAAAKRAVLGSVMAIPVPTALELPAPLGFETRPQADASPLLPLLFTVMPSVGFAAVPPAYKRPLTGGGSGVLAAALSLLRVIAGQSRLMQPEAALAQTQACQVSP